MIVKIILKLFITAAALIAIANYVPGISVSGWYPAIIAAIILAVVNVTLKPILLILTLPLTILTLGLFSFVVNAALFWFVSSFVQGFSVAGFLPALIGAFIMSVVSWLTHHLF
ncbi:MAG TPA: phage holin family protein [Candidatus Paceibacterota bacterium]